MVRLVELHFNHDPDSHHSDAFNIRAHGGTPGLIQAPEWTAERPDEPAVAAYCSNTLRNPVTVKARFAEGPANGTLRLRAIDALRTPSKPGGCEPNGCGEWLRYVGGVFVRAIAGNLLGEVQASDVAFDSAGNSGLIELELVDHLIGYGAVIAREGAWRWQYESDGSWADFDTTDHRIYVVPEMPRAPWQQAPYGEDNIQLPWITALDVACRWARFAATREDIARQVTTHLNGTRHCAYDGSSAFTFRDTFNLTTFLAHLGNTDRPFSVNCTDCAHAVTSLANLLGCNLAAGEIDRVGGSSFVTRHILPLGSAAEHSSWAQRNWDYHEVAWWEGDIGEHGLVYDASLKVDMDDNQSDTVHEAQLPAGMVYGALGPADYHYRLMGERLVEFGAGPLRLSVR